MLKYRISVFKLENGTIAHLNENTEEIRVIFSDGRKISYREYRNRHLYEELYDSLRRANYEGDFIIKPKYVLHENYNYHQNKFREDLKEDLTNIDLKPTKKKLKSFIRMLKPHGIDTKHLIRLYKYCDLRYGPHHSGELVWDHREGSIGVQTFIRFPHHSEYFDVTDYELW